MTADPFLPLEGASNFRDVGGLPVEGGGRVRHGLIFRANQLSGLSAADHAVLAPYGIRLVHDLRQGEERTRTPTNWPGPRIVAATERDHLPRWQQVLGGHAPDATGARQFLIDLYSRLPFDFAPRVAAIARGLAEGEGPCVIHCSAGKDRTGVVVALLLALAGVRYDAIEREYLLTEGRVGISADQQRAFARSQKDHADAGTAITPEMHGVLLSVHGDFLGAAFRAIAARHGDLDGYVDEALGLERPVLDAYRRVVVAH